MTSRKVKHEEFRILFQSALEIATKNAETKLGENIPHNFQIMFNGLGHSGTIIDVDKAAELLYLGNDTFFAIIDVAVIKVSDRKTTVFVRPSGHKPRAFEQTWNDPDGFGPFKQLISAKIEKEDIQ